MSLRPVIDKKRFLELGYARGTWDRMLHELPAQRPNGDDGRKVYLAIEDVERYLEERTITPDPPRRRRMAA